MLESMHMVTHVDSIGDPVLIGPERGEIAAWSESIVAKTGPLTMPRYPLLGLPEFATIAALDHYKLRKQARSEISASCAPTRAPTSRSLCPILNSLTA